MPLKVSQVNSYLAHKHHLLPSTRLVDVAQVTRDIVALHATSPTGPYLSLWTRVPDFQRQALEDTLYERRELARMHCMRMTVHAVPSDEVTFFFQAYVERHVPAELRGWESVLVQAGVCQQGEAEALLDKLCRQVLDVLAEKGPSMVRQISQAAPDLRAKIPHDVGKPYEGQFSIGSRLMLTMCVRGLLIRARPRGSWRSNLYEYAALSDWLPDVDMDSVTPEEAQAWLVRRYLAAFGPATFDDVQWWTGFTKGEAKVALDGLESAVVEVAVEGLGDDYLMLAKDAERLRDLAPPDGPYFSFSRISIPTSWATVIGVASWHRSIVRRSSTAQGTPCPPSGRAAGWWALGDSARATER